MSDSPYPDTAQNGGEELPPVRQLKGDNVPAPYAEAMQTKGDLFRCVGKLCIGDADDFVGVATRGDNSRPFRVRGGVWLEEIRQELVMPSAASPQGRRPSCVELDTPVDLLFLHDLPPWFGIGAVKSWIVQELSTYMYFYTRSLLFVENY
jgi:hypothetical protein